MSNELDTKESGNAVLVWIRLSNDGFGSEQEKQALYGLEDRLEAFFETSDIGEFDGNEIGMGYWTLYFYGPSADTLYDAVLPIIRAYDPPTGSYIVKRHGGPADTEERVDL